MATTSQVAKNLRTVLAQMADLDRAQRIKGLREGTIRRERPLPARQHLSQPQVIRGIEEMAGLAHFVSLRGYQEWERTGGILYENCARLADYFGCDPDWLFHGPEANEPAPGEAASNGLVVGLVKLEAKLDVLLGELGTLLTQLEAGDEAGAVQRAAGAAHARTAPRVEEAVRRGSAAQSPKPAKASRRQAD